jgi:hypothetical protein
MSTRIVDDALVAIARLERDRADLLVLLTRFHLHVFNYTTTEHDSPQQDVAFQTLMRTMSQVRTLVQQLSRHV